MQHVSIRQESVTIPTYEIGAYSHIPMFLEKRVYQGSSGRVYPHPVCEQVADEKTDHTYTAVFLENEYLQVMILPEIGGRIQRIYDKTNGYDAVYYNEVIKPALVGLAGPWISGGIEFNWPQHHRPSTFDPVDFWLEERPDGAATVWVGETEKMFRTKAACGFTLYPGKAYLEISGQLYNGTDRPQTFLWWANPAVAVNDDTQSVFPPDVHAVMDHGKRDVSAFPISKSVYYKMDYRPGTDISRYKNIPVPTSYMAHHSDYDFVGNYDHGRQAGLLHVADHHISPGKKQWTWGNGDFGRAWDRNLTDENGPYIELMTGMFTDNQPDFTFLKPYEGKRFVQYFLPYKEIGTVQNATKDVLLHLSTADDVAQFSVYVTGGQTLQIQLSDANEKLLFSETASLSPQKAFCASASLCGCALPVTLRVFDAHGKELLSFTPAPADAEEPLPEPATACKKPADIDSLEELYLSALHLEQYRHATYSPADYYEEGLRRDPSDIRLNNAYGRYLYHRGAFASAEEHFRAAIKKATWKNPNPYDCEPYYNLGLALKKQGKEAEAFDAFYKSVWDGHWQNAGFYELAALASRKGHFAEALDFVEQSLLCGARHLKARSLKTALLRQLHRHEEALAFAEETRRFDPLDHGCMRERYLLTKNKEDLSALQTLLRGDADSYLESAIDYLEWGMTKDALHLLSLAPVQTHPMIAYYTAYAAQDAARLAALAANSVDGCFPVRLHDIAVLSYAMAQNPSDAHAPYLLGNLWYDKGQWQEAKRCWETAAALSKDNAVLHRNLSLLYFNKEGDGAKALQEMETAFALAPEDARIFFELDQLKKQLNVPVEERLSAMDGHARLLSQRDDLYTEYITLLNCTGQHEQALCAALEHRFHPWEGGEGKIPAQYKYALRALAEACLAQGDDAGAEAYLSRALLMPEQFGEGKLIGTLDNDVYYLLGKAYEGRDAAQAQECFTLALRGEEALSSAMYYNDQPPEMFYYRAMAAFSLGAEADAVAKLARLKEYGAAHRDDVVEIDYFAVSLPDFLIFDADLNRKNRVHTAYLSALGCAGLSETEEALRWCEVGLSEDCAHQGLLALRVALTKKY